jgi:GNAT superfamily N-acetyltransferase
MPCARFRDAVRVRPSPLPVGLGPGPFSTAEARLLAVPAQRLGRSDLVHPTRGAHALGEPEALVERASAYQVAMPRERAFSHLTAALLWGLPLPRALERRATAQDAPLHVIAPTRDGMAVRAGVVGHRGLEQRAVASPAGTALRVVDVADTWCDLGELPRGSLSLGDLVVAGDAAVALLDARSGRTVGFAALREALRRRNRPRGAVALRQALTQVRHGVRSPMESRARLMFVGAGFPEPEVNAPLTDRAGEWLAEGDLVWRRQRLVGEYQGDHHADRHRRSDDAFRRDLVEAHDWRVRELWAEDLHRGPRRRWTLTRFAQALDLDPATLRIA